MKGISSLLRHLGKLYLKGPGAVFRGNENHYVTQIMLPFEEE